MDPAGYLQGMLGQTNQLHLNIHLRGKSHEVPFWEVIGQEQNRLNWLHHYVVMPAGDNHDIADLHGPPPCPFSGSNGDVNPYLCRTKSGGDNTRRHG
jgi:hypothetical protein